MEEEDLINFLFAPTPLPQPQLPTPSGSQPIYSGCSLLVLEYVVAIFGFCLHHYKRAKTSIEHLLQFIQLVLPLNNCAPKTYHEISQVSIVLVVIKLTSFLHHYNLEQKELNFAINVFINYKMLLVLNVKIVKFPGTIFVREF